MNELAWLIRNTIYGAPGNFWWPHLSQGLVSERRFSASIKPFIGHVDYSTSGFLGGNLEGPLSEFSVIARIDSRWASVRVEILAGSVEAVFCEKGVGFYNQLDLEESNCLQTLADALGLIGCIPTLSESVQALVQSLHILRPDDPAIDVSFSEPYLPFSIFVSIPEDDLPNAAMRVAEAIIHEAMHLQLSLVEQVTPLVSGSTSLFYSPWRQAMRNSSGVLHALYVFRVIEEWLCEIITQTADTYASQRRTEIVNQICQVGALAADGDLTTDGVELCKKMLRI